MSINDARGMSGVLAVTKRILVLLASACLFYCGSATAATYTWTNNTAGTFLWSDPANWSNGVIPVSASDTEVLFSMNISSGTTVVADNDIGAFTLNKLTFTNEVALPANTTQTVSGAALTFDINGSTLPLINFRRNVAGFLYDIQNNLVLNTNTALVSAGGGAGPIIQLAGDISGTGPLSFGTNGAAAPSSAQIRLLGSNSFSGGITFRPGYRVVIASDASLGAVPGSVTPSSLVFTNGNLASAGGVVTINANRGISVQGPGVNFGISGPTGSELIYNGVIEGPGGLSVNAANTTLTLGGTNTYTGLTSINAGQLKVYYIAPLGQASGLGQPTTEANGRITFGNGGQLNYTGTGASTDRKIGFVTGNTILNNGTGLLNFTNTAADAITYTTPNQLTLGGSGPGGLLSGAITGNFASTSLAIGLSVDNAGTWVLTGTNTYTGKMTAIGGGVLQADEGVGLSPNAPVSFSAGSAAGSGGVLQNNGTAYPFTRSVGTNANQVSWGGAPSAVNHSPGGFAAKGAKFIVNLGGSSEMLTWASTPFFVGWSNKVQHLVFGSTTADKVIEFQNPINLNNATRTIQVNDNTNSVTDIAVLSGALTNGALTKTGAGVLHLDGANTYTGRTTVSAGYIGGNGSLVGSLTITNGAGFHAASGKTLHVASNVTLYATSILSEPGLPVGASHIVLTYGGTLTGSFGVTNLPAGSVVDYGTRTNSLITLTRPQSGTVFSFR